jgi:hypothetical protein
MRIRFRFRQKRANVRRTGLGRSDDGAKRGIDLAVLPPRYGRLGRPKPTSQCGLTDTCLPACSANDVSSMYRIKVSISANPIDSRSRK